MHWKVPLVWKAPPVNTCPTCFIAMEQRIPSATWTQSQRGKKRNVAKNQKDESDGMHTKSQRRRWRSVLNLQSKGGGRDASSFKLQVGWEDYAAATGRHGEDVSLDSRRGRVWGFYFVSAPFICQSDICKQVGNRRAAMHPTCPTRSESVDSESLMSRFYNDVNHKYPKCLLQTEQTALFLGLDNPLFAIQIEVTQGRKRKHPNTKIQRSLNSLS